MLDRTRVVPALLDGVIIERVVAILSAINSKLEGVTTGAG